MGDGKAIKNSRGATPNPAGEEAGSYMPDGTPIDGTEVSKPAPVSYVVDKDDAKSKADVKNMKSMKASHSNFVDVDALKNERHTKASSKATISNIDEKGDEADNLKNEKATKATSKGTVENKTEKGDEADNLKNV